MAIGAGKFGVGRVDMHELKALGVNLLHPFGVALRDDQVAGLTVAGFDRPLSVGRDVFAVVTSETSVPAFVTDEIGMGSPINLDLWEEVFAIN